LRIRIPRNITPQAAIALQKKLAPLVDETSQLPSEIKSLIGCDATYFHGTTVAAATRVDYEGLRFEDKKLIQEPTKFPYIPGLLAFREAPAVLKAIRALRARSYVCLVDAHGLAHPRRFGLACFVGIALDQPTIGVAKSLLYGRVNGNQVLDKENHPIAEIIALPTSGKSIYVSVGHKISLEEAAKVVKYCSDPAGPLPIRLAHEEVTRERWLIEKSNRVS
jgi:deoxyribonuclease V